MHSASTRFNSITLFSFTVLAVICVLNFFQGYLTFNSQHALKSFEITQLTNFISTNKWDQASFKYSLDAGTYRHSQIFPNFTTGISSNCMSMLNVNGIILQKM